jgi:hypothetical protein
MAGGLGYLLDEDRPYEDLASLKKFLRRVYNLNEFRFYYTVATGGAGASVELEEKTGTTVTRLTTGNEAQVYIRAHTNDNDYDTHSITLEAINEAGTILGPTTTLFNTTDSTTEVAVSGMTDYYRTRTMTSTITPKAGHTFSIGDADHANDGTGTDLWGVIEEGNLSSIHSRYYAPATSASGNTMRSFLAHMDWHYVGATAAANLEFATLTVTLTPKDLDYQTTMTLRADVGDYHHWEDPIELKPATEVTFTVADDSAVGGNFSLFTTILEGEKAQ